MLNIFRRLNLLLLLHCCAFLLLAGCGDDKKDEPDDMADVEEVSDGEGDTEPDIADEDVMDDEVSDEDIMEMDTGLTCDDLTCDANASCDDSGETPVCVCEPGYEGDGITCTALPDDPLQIATGTNHTCLLLANGQLFCWGDSTTGQVGAGVTFEQVLAPVQVGTRTAWSSVAAGRAHTCSIGTDGSLWCWGDNQQGATGTPGESIVSSPLQVGEDLDWSYVNTGDARTCAIKADETLWCWGRGAGGALGLGDQNDVEEPTQVGEFGWLDVSTGTNHTCGVQDDGSLHCWGSSLLGDVELMVPVLEPARIGSDNDWQSVTVGNDNTCAIKSSGELWCWGETSFGQSDVPVTEPTRVGSETDWETIAALGEHVCGTRAGAQAWCWGVNNRGQVGSGSTLLQPEPVRVEDSTWVDVDAGGQHSCGIRADLGIFCWGDNTLAQHGLGFLPELEDPTQTPSQASWQALDMSEDFGCGVQDDGSLWCWGDNASGQLGTGDAPLGDNYASQSLPASVDGMLTADAVATGTSHACARTSSGGIWCWGDNASGQLGDGGMTLSASPVQESTQATDWSQVDAGNAHTCAIKSDGSLWCWGDEASGALGNDADMGTQATPVQEATGASDWDQVAVGGNNTCAIKADQSLWCWGDNSAGQVGDDSTDNRLQPTAVSGGGTWNNVDIGNGLVCGVQTDNSLWCWGSGVNVGDFVQTPTQITTSNDWESVRVDALWVCAQRTNGLVRCFRGYDEQNLDGPPMNDWNVVTASGDGFPFYVGIKTDDTLWSWGSANDGQLAQGLAFATSPRPVPDP